MGDCNLKSTSIPVIDLKQVSELREMCYQRTVVYTCCGLRVRQRGVHCEAFCRRDVFLCWVKQTVLTLPACEPSGHCNEMSEEEKEFVRCELTVWSPVSAVKRTFLKVSFDCLKVVRCAVLLFRVDHYRWKSTSIIVELNTDEKLKLPMINCSKTSNVKYD